MRTTTKVLKFPLSGVARDLDYRKAYIPSEESTFATPFAVNVRGTDSFRRRNRGGSRPGLWAVSVSESSLVNRPHEHPLIVGLTGITPSATCVYRTRHCCASGIAWYMSAIGDTEDWDFYGDAEDPSRAVSGSIANASRLGETITALMPIRDDYLFIATAHSLWCLTGDPIGGTLRCVSEHIGCVSENAWCFDGSRIWLVSNNGVYAFGVGEIPMLVSHKIPEDFSGMTSAYLVYDHDETAIHIFGNNGPAANDWFYDIENKAFWKMSFAASHRPTDSAYLLVNGVEKAVFKGGDSSWRAFDDTKATDGGLTIVSEVALGPVRCSDGDDVDGMLAEAYGTIAEGSVNVGCDIYLAHSPEKAVEIARSASGTPYGFDLKVGWNNVVRPRGRGAWAVFVLSANGRWGFESMTATFKALGRLR